MVVSMAVAWAGMMVGTTVEMWAAQLADGWVAQSAVVKGER